MEERAFTALVPTPLSPTDFLNALESYLPPVFILETTSTTTQGMLKLQKPLSCSASSTYESASSNDFSCENLYDNDYTMWQDNSLNCKDGWLEFNFSEEIYIEDLAIKVYLAT